MQSLLYTMVLLGEPPYSGRDIVKCTVIPLLC